MSDRESRIVAAARRVISAEDAVAEVEAAWSDAPVLMYHGVKAPSAGAPADLTYDDVLKLSGRQRRADNELKAARDELRRAVTA